MRYKLKKLTQILILVSILFFACAPLASATPRMPVRYYGYVYVNGEIVPGGTLVTVEMNGTGEEIGRTEVGVDGVPSGMYLCTINLPNTEDSAQIPLPGDEIVWKVNGVLSKVDPKDGSDIRSVIKLGDEGKSYSLDIYSYANRAPVLAEIGSKSVTENTELKIILSATDEDGDTLTFSKNADSVGTLTGNVFTWTPGYNDEGTYSVEFSVSDGKGGTDSEVVQITVGNANRTPVLANIGPKSVAENTELKIELSATDEDGDTLTFSKNEGSVGTLTGNVFTWTPGYDKEGIYSIEFSVSDGKGGIDSEVVQITVGNTNRVPVLAEIGPKSAKEGLELKIILSAMDEDGDTLTFAKNEGSVGTLTGSVFTWTPGYNDEGTYSVEFSVSDGKGGADSEIVQITVGDSNRNPVLANIGPQSIAENTELKIVLSATDEDGDTLTYSKNEGSVGTLTSNVFTWIPEYGDEGIHSVEFSVSDGKGGTDSEIIQITVGDANRNPVLAEIGPKSVEENSELKIILSATDEDGDIFTFAKNESSVGTLTGNIFTWTPGYSDEGIYSVEFSVSDGKGGIDSEIVQITVGNINRVPVLTEIGPKSVVENTELVIELSATDEDGDTLTFSKNESSVGTLTGNVFTWTPGYNDEGIYSVEFSVSDGKGGTDSEIIQITVGDLNRAPVLANIGPKSVAENTELKIELSATDEDGDIITFSKNEGSVGILAGNVFTWTPGYDDEGTHSVEFSVSDGKGGSDSEIVQITVGNANRAPVLAEIGSKSAEEGSELKIVLSATDEDGDTLIFAKNEGSVGTLTSNIFTWIPGYNDEGIYSVEFSVSDGKGGLDSEIVEITVGDANRNPVLAEIGPKSVTENTELKIELSATDEDGDTLTYSKNEGSVGILTGNIFTWTPGYEEEGIYSVEFIVSDGKGSTDSEIVQITVGNSNRNPVLAEIGPKSVNENTELKIILSATDEDGDILTFSKNESSVGILAGNVFTWTPEYGDEGTYSVEFSVSDGKGGTDSEVVQITVGNVNRNPILAEIGPKSVEEGSELRIELSATDEDGDTLTFAKNEGSVGTLTGNVFTWTPGYDEEGIYSVEFSVSDGKGGSDSEIVQITVGNMNRAPMLINIGPQSAAENTELKIVLSATDEDGDTLTFSKNEGSVGILIGNVFTWTPEYNDEGIYSVEFSVSDGKGGLDSEIAEITVGDANRNPVLAEIGPKSVNENTELKIILSATDEDGDILTFSKNESSVGTLTGNVFTWTPGYNDEGIYSVEFSVSDGKGGADSEIVQITVEGANRAPLLAYIGPKSVTENTELKIELSATDEDGDTLTYSKNEGSVGIITGNVFTWTPADGDEGTYSVEFSVSDGRRGTDSEIVKITVNTVSIRAVNAGSDKTVEEGNTVSFEGNFVASESNTYSILWDFGDGSTAVDDLKPSHTYSDDGVYTVTLHVTSDDGGTGTDILVVTVNNADPDVEAGSDIEVTAGDSISFSGTFSDPGWLDTHNAEWNFGEGTVKAGSVSEENEYPDSTGTVSGSFSYFDTGGYTVILSVSDDDGGVGQDQLTVTVRPIKAEVTFDPKNFNLNSNGDWVTAYIELPANYNVSGIDIGSVLMNGTVPAVSDPKYNFVTNESEYLTDLDYDGISERMFKFNRRDAAGILKTGDKVTVTLTGKVEYDNGISSGTANFEGSDVIKVTKKDNKKG